MVCLTVLALFASALISSRIPEEGWQLPAWAWAFAAGALTYWRTRRVIGVRIYAIAIASLFPIALLTHGFTLYAAKVSVCCSLLLILGCGFRVPDGVASHTLGIIGIRSYSIYLTHGLVGTRLIDRMAVMLPNGGRATAWLELVAASTARIIAGSIFYHLVERPTSRLASKIEYRR